MTAWKNSGENNKDFSEEINENVKEAADNISGVSHVLVEPKGTATVTVDDSGQVLPELLSRLINEGYLVKSVEILKPNLETVFLELTGRALRD